MDERQQRRIDPRGWARIGAGAAAILAVGLVPTGSGSEIDGILSGLLWGLVALGLASVGLLLVLWGMARLVRRQDAILGRSLTLGALVLILATVGHWTWEVTEAGPRRVNSPPAACQGTRTAATAARGRNRIGSGERRSSLPLVLDGERREIISGDSVLVPGGVVTLGRFAESPERLHLIVQGVSSATLDVTERLPLGGRLAQALWTSDAELLIRTRSGRVARTSEDLSSFRMLTPPQAFVDANRGAFGANDPILLGDTVLFWTPAEGRLFTLSLADDGWRSSPATEPGLWAVAAREGTALCMELEDDRYWALDANLREASLGPGLEVALDTLGGGGTTGLALAIVTFPLLAAWLARLARHRRRGLLSARATDTWWIRAGLLSAVIAAASALLVFIR